MNTEQCDPNRDAPRKCEICTEKQPSIRNMIADTIVVKV
jgi:hypothetical protein